MNNVHFFRFLFAPQYPVKSNFVKHRTICLEDLNIWGTMPCHLVKENLKFDL